MFVISMSFIFVATEVVWTLSSLYILVPKTESPIQYIKENWRFLMHLCIIHCVSSAIGMLCADIYMDRYREIPNYPLSDTN